MISVDTSYSCTPRCDSRTQMSIGLSLLAALVTTAVFVVLANKGYISPTVAYSAAPSIGAALILIGAAVALIRKDREIPQLTEIEISQLIETQKGVTLEKEITFHPPDRAHPYAYYTVTLNFGTHRISGVEILERETPNDEGVTNILFVYEGKRYIKQTQVLFSFWHPTLQRNAERNAFTQWDEDLATWSGKKYLSKEKYQILMQEGNSAEFFKICDSFGLDTEQKGVVFEIPGFLEWKRQGSTIIIFKTIRECPEELLEGLKDHPDVIKKLSAEEWTWNPPIDVTFFRLKHRFRKDIYIPFKSAGVTTDTQPSSAVSQPTTKKRTDKPKTPLFNADDELFMINAFKQIIAQKIEVLNPADQECPHDYYTITGNFDDYSVKFFYYEEAGSFKLSHRLLS